MTRAASLLALAAVLQGCEEDRNYNLGVPGSSASSSSTVPASSGEAAEAPDSGAAAAPMGAPIRRNDAPRAAAAAPEAGASSSSSAAPSAPMQSSSASQADPSAGAGAGGSTAGAEPFKALARTARFNEFRGISTRYLQLKRELYPLGLKLADGSATDEERKRYYALEAKVEDAWRPVNAYMWDERWSEEDRAAMGWILYGDMQPAVR